VFAVVNRPGPRRTLLCRITDRYWATALMKRVLIADDSDTVRGVIRAFLEERLDVAV
jgi:hypothetical protein